MDIKQARVEAQGALERTSKEARGTDWDGAVAVVSREALKTLLFRLDELEDKELAE
jgi:hypothetical protein